MPNGGLSRVCGLSMAVSLLALRVATAWGSSLTASAAGDRDVLAESGEGGAPAQEPGPAAVEATPAEGGTPTAPDAAAPGPAADAAAAEVPSASAPQAKASPSVPPPSVERPATMDELADSSVQEMHFGHVSARYSLNFFGDFSFALKSPSSGERHPAFSLGAQDFLIRGDLGAHIVATTEFAVEFGDTNQAGVDLERLHVRWENAHYFVQAGRSHTEIGYFNNAYHHGHWLQPTIERPSWVRFEDEGGLLPIHTVGVSAGATTALGPGSLRGVVSVSNGRGYVQDDIRNEYDYSARKAFHAALEAVGVGLRDLRLGLSGFYDRIPAAPAALRPALPDTAIDEWILGAHVAYPSAPLLVIVEGYLIDHHAAGRSYRTYGGFGVVGYALNFVTPYLEVSGIASSGSRDPFFIPDPSAGRSSLDELELIAGTRIDTSDWSALKFEYRFVNAKSQALVPRHEGVVNWSWGF